MPAAMILLISGLDRYTYPQVDYFVNSRNDPDGRWCVDWEHFGRKSHGVEPEFKAQKIVLGDIEINSLLACSHMLTDTKERSHSTPTVKDCLMAVDAGVVKGEDILQWVASQATWITSSRARMRLSIQTHSAVVYGKRGEQSGPFLITLDPKNNRNHPELVITPITEDSLIIDNTVVTVASRLQDKRDRAEAHLNAVLKMIDGYDTHVDKAKFIDHNDFLMPGYRHRD